MKKIFSLLAIVVLASAFTLPANDPFGDKRYKEFADTGKSATSGKSVFADRP